MKAEDLKNGQYHLIKDVLLNIWKFVFAEKPPILLNEMKPDNLKDLPSDKPELDKEKDSKAQSDEANQKFKSSNNLMITNAASNENASDH